MPSYSWTVTLIWHVSAVSTDSSGVAKTVQNCGCIGGFTTQGPSTVINRTPMVYCGSNTMQDPDPPEYSVAPAMSSGAAVPFGNFNPMDMISSISASCANGCGGITTTYSATTVASPSSVSGISAPTQLAVEYIITTDIVQPSDWGVIVQGLSAMLSSGGTSTEEFTYDNYQFPPDGQSGYSEFDDWTNYYAPSHMSFTRYVQDTTGAYAAVADSFSFGITSEIVNPSSDLCSTITGPIFAALGAIPEAGPVFGILGSFICDLFQS